MRLQAGGTRQGPACVHAPEAQALCLATCARTNSYEKTWLLLWLRRGWADGTQTRLERVGAGFGPVKLAVVVVAWTGRLQEGGADA